MKVLYQNAYEASTQTDSNSARHRARLETLVSTLAANAELVNQNATEIEEELFSAVQLALSELQRITQGKLQHLLSCEMEVRRQLQEMDAAEALLAAQRTQMEPLQFCEAWPRHQHLRERLRSIPAPRVDAAVETPISIEGSIQPVCRAQVSNEPVVHDEPIPDPVVTNKSEQQSQDVVVTIDETNRLQELDQNMSLSRLADEHRRAVIEMGILMKPHTPFTGSNVLSTQQGSVLFYAIGFCDEPDTNLLYSTQRDGFSLERFHSSCDGVGPTALVARVGEYVFGGYAGTSWNRNATRFGTPKSFIFNLAPHDIKVEYSPQGAQSCCLW